MATESVDLVQQAISAGKAGNVSEARRLLKRLTDAEPQNDTAWLWLAALAETPQEALADLQRVLEINPHNERALAHLKTVRLQLGVAACQGGEKEEGRRFLRLVLEQEPNNEQAFLWLAAVADSPAEAIGHLEQVLQFNPTHERAISGIAYYRSLEPLSQPAPEAAWYCPLCYAVGAASVPQCTVCKAILHLRDPESFLNNYGLDAAKVKDAVIRLDYALANIAPVSDEYLLHYHVGLAHLNLRQFEEAIAHLRVAVSVGKKDTTELRQLLDDLLRLRPQFATAPKTPVGELLPRMPWASLTIMVVDTQPSMRKLVSLTMKRSGFKVLESADGYEMGQNLQNGQLPDLVFLQFELPGANGYQLCQMLRTNPEMQHVPIVLMSTNDGFLHRLRGRWAGCSDFITKPFEPEELLAMVRKHCEKKLFPAGKPSSTILRAAKLT